VAAFQRVIVDVDGARIADPKTEQSEQACQPVVGDAGGSALSDERAQSHPVQAEGLGLVGDLGAAHELER
jgi:hypothetical protein